MQRARIFFASDSGLTPVWLAGLLETGIGSFFGVDNRENEHQEAHRKRTEQTVAVKRRERLLSLSAGLRGRGISLCAQARD